MKRIGIFLRCSPICGGSYQYAQILLKGLSTLQFDKYKIIAIYTDTSWEEELKEYLFDSVCIEDDMSYLSESIDGLECDIIFCSSQDNLAECIRTRTISIIHDLMHRYERRFPEVSDAGEYEARERLYKMICECSCGILVDSELGKDHVIESYGQIFSDKIYVLPFVPPQYLLQCKEKNNIIEKFRDSFRLFKKYIFYPAQFWLHKNHKSLLLAIAKLRDKGIIVDLVLAGTKKNGFTEVEFLIQELNLTKHVRILGYVSEKQMYFLYKNARAMVMPTFFGPTNIPPLEGFLTDCPVAVSDVYAMKEQVGDAALLFDPQNVNEIADVIEKLWLDDDLCNDLILKGKKRIQRYSQDIFNRRLKEILNIVLQKEKNKKHWGDELIEFCRKHRYVLCYGAGEYGYLVRIFLMSVSVNVNAFIVSEKNIKKRSYMNLPVYLLSEVPYPLEECGIVLSLSSRYYGIVEDILKSNGIKKYYILNLEEVKNLNYYFTSFEGMKQRIIFEYEMEKNYKYR